MAKAECWDTCEQERNMIDFRSMGVGIRYSALQCLRWAIACVILRVHKMFGFVLLSAQGGLSEKVCCKPLGLKNKNSKSRVLGHL